MANFVEKCVDKIEYIEEFEQCWAELKDHVAEATGATGANAGEEVQGGEPVKKNTKTAKTYLFYHYAKVSLSMYIKCPPSTPPRKEPTSSVAFSRGW